MKNVSRARQVFQDLLSKLRQGQKSKEPDEDEHSVYFGVGGSPDTPEMKNSQAAAGGHHVM